MKPTRPSPMKQYEPIRLLGEPRSRPALDHPGVKAAVWLVLLLAAWGVVALLALLSWLLVVALQGLA